jgi:hypothetical protein
MILWIEDSRDSIQKLGKGGMEMKTFKNLLLVTLVMAAIASASAASVVGSIMAPLWNATSEINHAGMNPVVRASASKEATPDAVLATGTWSENFIVPQSPAMPMFRYVSIDMKVQGFDLGQFTGVDVSLEDQHSTQGTNISRSEIDRNDLKKESKKGNVYADPSGAYKGSGKFCEGNITTGALTLRADGLLVIDTWALGPDVYALEFGMTHTGKKNKKDIAIFFHSSSHEKITDTNTFFFSIVEPSQYLNDYCQAQANKNYEAADGRIQSLAFSSYYDEVLKHYWTLLVTPISANLKANTLWREAANEQKPLEKLPVSSDCTHWVKLEKDGKAFSGWVEVKVSEEQAESYLLQGPMLSFDGAKAGSQKLWIRQDGKDAWTIKMIDVRQNGVSVVTL